MDTSFEGDAAFFDAAASRAGNPDDKVELHLVAETCRALGKLDLPETAPLPAERWRFRAEECRTLADQFSNAECRQQLTRLAATYDYFAVSQDTADYLNSLKSGRADARELPL